jgi:golgi-specific brefeldin A-resistance guanine nucleotide exchange factor 1
MWCTCIYPSFLACQADLCSTLPVDALKPLIQALLSELPDDPSSIVINVRSDEEPPAPTNGQKSTSSGPVYDPSIVYLLELCTVLTLRDNETVAAFGGGVAEALQSVMRQASSYHHAIVSRSIYYLLHLLQASYVSTITPWLR